MTTKCGCGGFSGLPVTADIGKQPGRARPAPTGVVNEGTAVSGKSESSSRERQSVGSRSNKGKQGRLPHSREGARGIRKISACALYGKDLYYYYNTI